MRGTAAGSTLMSLAVHLAIWASRWRRAAERDGTVVYRYEDR